MTEQDEKYRFKGQMFSARLLSNALSYGPEPQPEEEIEQHLQLQADGTARITAYCFGNGEEYPLLRDEELLIGAEAAGELLGLLTACFEKPQEDSFVPDVPEWSLILKNDEGREYRFSGPMVPGSAELERLSRCLRARLKQPNLFAFDGRAFVDQIERVTVDYFRDTAGQTRQEHLVLDRADESLTFHCMQNGMRSLLNLQKEGLASDLLDRFEPDTFLRDVPAYRQKSAQDPDDKREYSIGIWYRTKEPYFIHGSFSAVALSKDYKEFIGDAFLLCGECGAWELEPIEK